MNGIKLSENICPLCGLQGVESIPVIGGDGGRYYYCPNCGPFSITYWAYRFTPIINNDEVKAELSYYICHNSTEESPIFIDRNFYEETIDT